MGVRRPFCLRLSDWMSARAGFFSPGTAQNKEKNFGPGLARPIFFFLFRPRQLGLKDFKTGPFSCLHVINVFFFADDLFFHKLLKQSI